MTPSTERPRVEGDREQEILDATLEVLAEVGYDRLTMDAVAAKAKASKATLYRRWTNKVSLVDRRARSTSRARTRSPTPAPCAATCSRSSAASAASSTRRASSTFASVLTARPRRRVRRGVPARRRRPQDRRRRAVWERAARPRRAPRPTSTSTCSSPPWPGSCCTASSCSARPRPDVITRVDRPDHPARCHPRAGVLHPDREREGTLMTDAPDYRGHHLGQEAAPGMGARAHLGGAADGGARRHHRQHRPAVHPARPGHLAGEPDLGRDRLRPRLRRPAAARRPARRPLRPPPGLHDRPHRLRVASLLGGLATQRGDCCSPPGASRASAPRSPLPPRWP